MKQVLSCLADAEAKMVTSLSSHESTKKKKKAHLFANLLSKDFWVLFLATQETHHFKNKHMTSDLAFICGHDLASQGTFISSKAMWLSGRRFAVVFAVMTVV